MVGDVDDTT
jgi:hypothetical protein